MVRRWFAWLPVVLLAAAAVPLAGRSRPDKAPPAGRAKADADFDKTFSHHTVKVNGVRLHYVVGGKGDAVLLLHGWPQSWHEWKRVLPTLAEKYTVIAPDLRGFGESDKPADGYDAANVAEDVHQLVRHLKHDKVYVVSHDIGSMVAYAYASKYPKEVVKLVVSEFDLPGLGLEKLMDTSKPTGSWHFGFHAQPNLPEALIAGRERLYLSHFFKHFAYDPTAIPDEDVDLYARQYAAPGAARGGFMHYRAFPATAEQNKRFARKKLPMPVLAMGGDGSLGDRVLATMKPLCDDVRGVVIERCGHWIPEERPGPFVRQLLDFFAEEKGKGPAK